jgi:hypothetical protein
MEDKQLWLDVELVLAQVRATIQADCRVLDFGMTEKGFSVALVVGEHDGEHEWLYHLDILEGRDIPVSAVAIKVIASWEEYAIRIPVEEFWAQHVEFIITQFFERNPEYEKAIQ